MSLGMINGEQALLSLTAEQAAGSQLMPVHDYQQSVLGHKENTHARYLVRKLNAERSEREQRSIETSLRLKHLASKK